ncbi:helix-turn-helix domain-containing protein [Dyadobacter subterraneus]|uniref:Helix-turn-helix transcriptional regulator n=1 Tax=Dyadobacter subterraneus TaxID=2773304 RepID=A0ABR9W6D7_9BACT|nr:helix-turn-helix transcriptional regulator [Dyadobacter subterraneus]MBE9461030.1 helix-turn-helix transcriptional regulator [Dyadobacter subterraneus]
MNVGVETKLKAVATNIRKIREYRGYPQEYLAMKLGISQNAYSKIELAYTRLTVERLLEITSILEIDIVTLLNNTNGDMVQLNSKAVQK